VLLGIKSFLPETYTVVTGGGSVTPTLEFARWLTALRRPPSRPVRCVTCSGRAALPSPAGEGQLVLATLANPRCGP
jgi:hypothetical protein